MTRYNVAFLQVPLTDNAKMSFEFAWTDPIEVYVLRVDRPTNYLKFARKFKEGESGFDSPVPVEELVGVPFRLVSKDYFDPKIGIIIDD